MVYMCALLLYFWNFIYVSKSYLYSCRSSVIPTNIVRFRGIVLWQQLVQLLNIYIHIIIKMAIPINPNKNRHAVTAYIHMYTQIYAHMHIIVYCKGNLFSMNKLISCKYYTMYNRASGNSPAAPVLAGPVFSR